MLKEKLNLMIAYMLMVFGLSNRKDYENYKFNIKLLSGTLVLAFIMLNVGMVSAIGTSPSIDPNMVLYLKFNESINYAYDYSLINNNVSMINVSLISSYSITNDSSVNFSNTNKGNSYVLVNDSSTSINITGSKLTISFLININERPDNDVFISKYTTNNGFRLISYSGKMLFYVGNGTGNVQVTPASELIPLNQWVHYVATYNGSEALIYKNGLKIANKSYAGNINYAPINLTIGGVLSTASYSINGSMDDVIIYNRTLSSDEIYDLSAHYFEYCTSNMDIVPCSIPSSKSLVLNNSIYSINGSLSTNYIINISGNSVTLDCNNSFFYGNYTDRDSFIYTSIGLSGFTLKNCNFNNSYYPLYLLYGSSAQIINNSFNNFGRIRHLGYRNTNYTGNIFFNSSYDESGSLYIQLDSGYTASNIIISNNSFLTAGLYHTYFRNATNITIQNNYFSQPNNRKSGYIRESYNITIKNNLMISSDNWEETMNNYIYFINNSYSDNGGIYSLNSQNIYVKDDYSNNTVGSTYKFENCTNVDIINYRGLNNVAGGALLHIKNSSNVYVFNSSFYNSTYNIIVERNSKNILFDNISIDFSSFGMEFLKSSNIIIRNSFINNSIGNYDAYNNGITLLSNNTNVTIDNVRIYNYGTNGIYWNFINDLTIKNCYFDEMSLTNKLVNNVKTYREIPAALGGYLVYMTWLGIGGETVNDNFTNKIINYRSYNVNISNISFGSNVQVKLYNSGTYNLTLDNSLNNYWYNSHRFPYINDRVHIYISNLFNNITSTISAIPTSLSNSLIGAGWMNIIYSSINITKDYSYYLMGSNSNYSNLELFNLSSSLVYHDNGTASIRSNEYNVTLQPNEEVYVYSNYNCSYTEQAKTKYPCGREGSPINITSLSLGNITTLRISSTVDNNINIPFEYQMNCTNLYSLQFRTKGDLNIIKQGTDAVTECNKLRSTTLYMNITETTSSSFNEIIATYNVSTTVTNGTITQGYVTTGGSGNTGGAATVINKTTSISTMLQIDGLTDALIYNDSYNIKGSMDVNANDGNINLTIGENETVYILNRYNKDERYVRDYDPLNITTSSKITKTIDSLLYDSINLTVILNLTSPLNIYVSPANNSNLMFFNQSQYSKVSNLNQINITIDHSGDNTNSISTNYIKNNGLNDKNISTNSLNSELVYLSNGTIFIISGTNQSYDFSFNAEEYAYLFENTVIGEMYNNYNPIALVGTNEDYELGIAYDSSLYTIKTTLMYNKTAQSPKEELNNNTVVSSKELQITMNYVPTQTFYWLINLTNSSGFSTYYNSTFGTQLVSTSRYLTTFYDYNGDETVASGYYTDSNNTNYFNNVTYLLILPTSVNVGRVLVFFGWNNQNANYTQFYEYDHDGTTIIREDLTILQGRDVQNWYRVLDESGNPIKDALLRVSLSDISIGGEYKEFGQRYSDVNGYTYFYFDSATAVNLRVTKEGYEAYQEEVDVNAQSYSYSSPRVIVLERSEVKAVSDSNIYTKVSTNEYDPLNTSKIYVNVYAPGENEIAYTTSYRQSIGASHVTMELNQYKNSILELERGVDYSSDNVTSDLQIYLWGVAHNNSIKTTTISYKAGKDTSKFNTPLNLDDSFKKGLTWIALILLTGLVGLFIKSGDESAGEGRKGKAIFFIGIILINILFPLELGVLLIIVGLYYGLMFVRKWISE